MEEKNVVNVNPLPLSTIGVLTGIVLSVLQATNVINIGWFWATFPFWIVPALWFVFITIVLIVVGTISLIKK